MKVKKVLTILGLFMLGALLLAGCGTAKEEAQAPKDDPAKTEATAPADNGGAGFKEYPIGEEVQAEGLNIAAVYLKPVTMEPEAKAGLKHDQSDIHLEADISALENNPLGFGVGEFVPYLTVKYKLENKDNGKTQEGSFMPMNAGDGSHYGANIKMLGAGNYKVTYIIDSPEKQDFLIHVDKDTGVPGSFWKKSIEAQYEFSYIPRKF